MPDMPDMPDFIQAASKPLLGQIDASISAVCDLWGPGRTSCAQPPWTHDYGTLAVLDNDAYNQTLAAVVTNLADLSLQQEVCLSCLQNLPDFLIN